MGVVLFWIKAKYLLGKMNFVRRKPSTKRPKSQYEILRNRDPILDGYKGYFYNRS